MTTSGGWILWLLINLILILSTRNPVYLFISLIGLLFSGYFLSHEEKGAAWLRQNLRFLLSLTLLSSTINAFFSHTGNTILLTFPEGWLLVGGDITLESIVYGAINGIIIVELFLLFNIINQALRIKQIIRLVPRTFYPLAIIGTLALTFFPSIQQRAREIKEAQMIRGNQMKKITDWLPILVPLLVASLEKALLVSESMTARGFHIQQESKPRIFTISGLILATFLFFSGWILNLYDYPHWLTNLLYFFGSSFFIIILVLAGRQTGITHLHKDTWRLKDILACVTLSCSLICFILLILKDALPSLSYSPYLTLSFPDIQWIAVLFAINSFLPVLLKPND